MGPIYTLRNKGSSGVLWIVVGCFGGQRVLGEYRGSSRCTDTAQGFFVCIGGASHCVGFFRLIIVYPRAHIDLYG